MKDQPKPRKQDAAKPTTGDWTERILNAIRQMDSGMTVDELSVINAALAAEREKYETAEREYQRMGKAKFEADVQIQQLRDQLADTIKASNEVTDENIDLERQLADATHKNLWLNNELLKKHKEFAAAHAANKGVLEWAKQVASDGSLISYQDLEQQFASPSTTALAAEREKAEAQDWRHMEKAHREVMLEREKVQRLVDALTRIRSESLSWTELQNIAADALAKAEPRSTRVKEGKA